jgi:2-keto-3-deoxy-L-rhamnonate aldolase RhmA
MRGQQLRTKMQSGQPLLNLSVSFHSPAVVEILGYTDADIIFLDAEHGAISEANCEDMIRAADSREKPVIIRVPKNEDHIILRYLDIGASGIMVPHLATREDAERAVAAIKYPPAGHRSFAPGRAAGWGTRESNLEYTQRANRETVVIGLFEDIRGVPFLDEILAVPGLDALLIGPFDLAASMGYSGEPWHAPVQTVILEVIAACRQAGKPSGLPASTIDSARQGIGLGAQIITVSVSALLINETRTYLKTVFGRP